METNSLNQKLYLENNLAKVMSILRSLKIDDILCYGAYILSRNAFDGDI